MTGFTFRTTPDARFGWGAADALGEAVAPLMRRALIVTDANVRALDGFARALASLEAAGVAVSIYDGVAPDPPVACVEAATEAATAHGADGVIGFGGGSSMDTAKLAALLARSPQPLEGAYGVGNCRGPRLPLACVPTTSGTGSEMTPISVLTKSETEKMGVSDWVLLPDLAVLDPALTASVPPEHRAACGVDAMVHAIEAYSTKLLKNPVSDALAIEALRRLTAAAAPAMEGDEAALGEMLLGAMLAGKAFANAPCAAVHALAYPLGARFHVTHGLSNAMLLAPVMRYNEPDCAALYARLGEAVFGTARDTVERFAGIGPALGLPERLSALGIPEDALATMAADAMAQTRLLRNNPREVGEADALAIYRAAF